MSPAIEAPVADKKRDDKAVKIAREVVIKAKTVVDSGIIKNSGGETVKTVAEYLSMLLRTPVNRDWQKAVRVIENPPAD